VGVETSEHDVVTDQCDAVVVDKHVAHGHSIGGPDRDGVVVDASDRVVGVVADPDGLVDDVDRLEIGDVGDIGS